MPTLTIHPANPDQETAIRIFLDALHVEYKANDETDETAYLMSSPAMINQLNTAITAGTKRRGYKGHIRRHMEIVLLPTASEDLKFWKESGNSIILKRIRQLLEAIQTNPFTGIGKPEPLKYNWSGKWSRRINNEHRLIYRIDENKIIVYSLRFHY